MRIRNISPLGDLVVPILGDRRQVIVPAGGELDVANDLGSALIEQTANWAPVTGAPATSEE